MKNLKVVNSVAYTFCLKIKCGTFLKLGVLKNEYKNSYLMRHGLWNCATL